jgi:hypothetical protein
MLQGHRLLAIGIRPEGDERLTTSKMSAPLQRSARRASILHFAIQVQAIDCKV